jgi:hypothetical protein
MSTIKTTKTRQATLLMLSLCLAMAVGGCGAGKSQTAPVIVPPVVPGEDTTGPDLSGVNLPGLIVPTISGRVSRPNLQLTPGAIAVTDTAAVCNQPHHVHQSIPFTDQAAVWQEYGYTTSQQHHYLLDYLVPLSLGGSADVTNLWPAALRGTGYYQKQKLNVILRDAVCHRTVSLATAQSQLQKDWFAAYLEYVVSTGKG